MFVTKQHIHPNLPSNADLSTDCFNLDAHATYRAAAQIATGGPAQEYSGATLMDEGLHIELPQRYRAAVHVVTRREGTA